MKNAHQEVKKTARFMTENNSNLGVEKVIEQVIKANTN
jgi:hydroxymethylpyrimidine pyrophosphatase-like HAD family hydrolase